MKILVIEALFAGLLKEFPPSILPEALSMLTAISNDFSRLNHQVSIIIDNRFLKFILPTKFSNINIIKVSQPNMRLIKRIASNHDYTYIIAPEAENLLYNLLSILEGYHINPKPETVIKVSDKFKMIKTLTKSNLYLPRTVMINNYSDINQLISEFNFPLIIKPVIGVGCEGLKLVESKSILKSYLSKALKKFPSLLIQEYIRGVPASISSITDGYRVIILSVNRQFISYRKQSYLGGYTPIKYVNFREIQDIIKKIITLYRGLRGYFGVDIVISNGHPYVMEINPRLTVSYIGISKISRYNLANLILKSTTKSIKDDTQILHDGVAYFRKIKFHRFIPENLRREIQTLFNLYTPLMSIDNKSFYSMILISGSSFKSAAKQYHNVIKMIREIITK